MSGPDVVALGRGVPDVVVCGRGVPDQGSPLLGVFELDQARALQAAGLSVAYAGLDVRSLRRRRRVGYRHEVGDGLDVHVLSVPVGQLPRSLNRGVMTPLWNVLLRRVVAAHGQPKVWHSHFLPWTAALVEARAVRGTPVVATEHWSQLTAAQLPADVQALGRRAYPQLAELVAVSQPLASSLATHFGAQAEVIGNIIDVETFAAAAANARSPGVRLVTTANLIARKNVDGLLRGFASAAPPDAELVVIGQGPERSTLDGLVSELGLRGRVRFTGRLTRAELAAEYACATGFALASHRETFGVVWAEALAAGLPVLATRCGGPEDFVQPVNGVLVDDEPGAIAAGLAELCDGIAESRWVAADLAGQARARFSAAVVTAELQRLYASLTR